MPARAPYRSRRADRSAETRRRIVGAVRELLSERRFHDSTMEDVAEHAGVSRATVYQHFRSRLDLTDAICDEMAVNPALLSLRENVGLPDVEEALARTITNSVQFWASEDALLSQLYGVVAVDPAAKDFVDRQRADRHGELERLARNLRLSGKSRVSEKRALQLLLLLTSYESYRELVEAGAGEREIAKTLKESGRTLVFGADG